LQSACSRLSNLSIPAIFWGIIDHRNSVVNGPLRMRLVTRLYLDRLTSVDQIVTST